MRLWLSIPAAAVVLLAFRWTDVSWGTVVASLLASGVMALMVARSQASGPALVVSVAGLYFVTFALINIPEGVLFGVIEPVDAPAGLVGTLIASVASALVVIAVAGRLRGDEPAARFAAPIQTVGDLLWRLAAAPAVFVVFYFIAGIIIIPYIESFYDMEAVPHPIAIVSMQVLRALAIVGAAYPLLRTLPTRRDAVLLLALALPVFGAIAPLLPPNDVMPASVRLVHALETVPYLGLFGALIAIWFGPPGRREEAQVHAAAT